MTQSFELFDPNRKGAMSFNKRILYMLVALLVVLLVLTGLLIWKFTQKCDEDHSNTAHLEMTTQPTDQPSTPAWTTAVPFEDGPWKDLRLPRSVIPVHYDIMLYPDFYGDKGWFYGNETIEIDIREPANHILVHVNYLNITKTSLEDSNGNSIEINRTFEFKPNQFLVIETKEALQVNQSVKLSISFDGSLSRDIVGFYKSVYLNSQTKEMR